MRQARSMLLLFIKIIPLPLHKFSSFLLISLILSWKSWSLQRMIFDYAILILSSVSYTSMEEITYLNFWRVFTLFRISFINYRIRFFLSSWSDIINEAICCWSRMTSRFHWIITRNFSPIYIHGHRIAYNKNFFLYCWAICRLLFNQVIIVVVFLYCCFIVLVLFIKGSLCIGFVISVGINFMIIRVVISFASVYTTSFIRLSILNYSAMLMVKLSSSYVPVKNLLSFVW